MAVPIPLDIKFLQKTRILEITFDNGQSYSLTCEYLRIFSPSAEVRGHGVGEGVLVTDKQNVNIIEIDPVGNYAIRLVFDDGHNTGIYSWETLYELAINYDENWQRYQQRLKNNI